MKTPACWRIIAYFDMLLVYIKVILPCKNLLLAEIRKNAGPNFLMAVCLRRSEFTSYTVTISTIGSGRVQQGTVSGPLSKRDSQKAYR
jgi:hypothetical protein